MMVFLKANVLTFAIFLPLVGALAVSAVPRGREAAARYVAIVSTLVTVVACLAVSMMVGGSGEFEIMSAVPWIPSLAVFYRIGVDGASSLLIVMTALLACISVLVSWNEIRHRQKFFFGLLLVAETGFVGAFAAVDMFLFCVFWHAAFVPLCFVIGIWGGKTRMRTALKFLIFSLVGSMAMLVAVMYAASEASSFSLLDWYAHDFAREAQVWLFAGLSLAFAIMTPLFGFHSWMSDAHAEAPTGGCILLSGTLFTLGGYGFFRIAIPLFPGAVAAFAPVMLLLAICTIIGGVLVAMAQEDIKRFLASLSLAQMGFVVLGFFSLERYAVTGAIIQLIGHGLMVAGLFVMSGLLFDRRGTHRISDFGGSARSLPVLAVLFILLLLSSAGLPGLIGFSGEFLVLLGSFQTKGAFAVAAVAGMVLIACTSIWFVRRIFFGDLAFEDERKMPDMQAREYLCILPLVVLIVVGGIWPSGMLTKVWKPADVFVSLAKRGQIVVPAANTGQGRSMNALKSGAFAEAVRGER